MATVNLTVEATAAQLEKISDYLGWTEKVTDENGDEIDNPQTRKAFVWSKVKSYLKQCYKAQVAKEADTTRVSALEQADTDLSTLEVTE